MPGGTVGPAPPNPHDFLLPRPPSSPWPPLAMSLPTHTYAHTTCRWPRVRMKQRLVKEAVKYMVCMGCKTDSLAMSLTGLPGLTAAVAAGDVTGTFQAGLWVERTSVRDPLKKRGGQAI